MKTPFNNLGEGTPFVKFKTTCNENKTNCSKMHHQKWFNIFIIYFKNE